MYIHIHIHIHLQIIIRSLYMYTCTYTYTHIHIQIHARTYIYQILYIFTHVYTYTYTYIYIPNIELNTLIFMWKSKISDWRQVCWNSRWARCKKNAASFGRTYPPRQLFTTSVMTLWLLKRVFFFFLFSLSFFAWKTCPSRNDLLPV